MKAIHKLLTNFLSLALLFSWNPVSSIAGGNDVKEPTKTEAAPAQANNNSSTLDDQKSVAITVYNSNIALVKDTRTLRLPRGTSQLRFMDVAQQINATSVAIKSLTAPNGLAVVEQKPTNMIC